MPVIIVLDKLTSCSLVLAAKFNKWYWKRIRKKKLQNGEKGKDVSKIATKVLNGRGGWNNTIGLIAWQVQQSNLYWWRHKNTKKMMMNCVVLKSRYSQPTKKKKFLSKVPKRRYCILFFFILHNSISPITLEEQNTNTRSNVWSLFLKLRKQFFSMQIKKLMINIYRYVLIKKKKRRFNKIKDLNCS